MADTPAGVAPVGTSPESMHVEASVTELRKLYFIVFGLTLGIRLACYIAAVVAFFMLSTSWRTLALIALLLVCGRGLAHAHSWAWRGYRAHSINADDPVMRERVIYEDSQARAAKAAKSALVREAAQRTKLADQAAKEALEQIDRVTETARERAEKATSLAKEQAVSAAADAMRIAAEARAQAASLAEKAQAAVPATPRVKAQAPVAPPAPPAPAPKAQASPVVVSIADAEHREPTDSADRAPVRPAV